MRARILGGVHAFWEPLPKIDQWGFMRILVTGGAGYIGSHTCVELLQRGQRLVIADNFSNSCPQVIDRIENITNVRPSVATLDLRDAAAVEGMFAGSDFDAVIHFAALKAVGESCQRPLDYFENNICGTINLLQAMRRHGVGQLVFSSSATVYGDPAQVPVREDAPLQVTNPYGRSKLVMEQLIEDAAGADPELRAINLRYFNPVGAHSSGLIGEDPNGIPNNLMPFLCQVAVGRLDKLRVFGDDWPTVDGTGVRDYIHVMDLARAHADALEFLARREDAVRVRALNLGTGRGTSVLQLLHALQRAVGRPIRYEVAPRRAGDVAAIYADPGLAQSLLGWRAELGVDAMCADAWRWQSRNPNGYR